MSTAVADPPTLAEAQAAYAEQLHHHSARIIGAVHDEGPDAVQQAIDRALIIPAPPGMDPAVSLITVLAAQVNPEATTQERLGWVADLAARSLSRRPDERDRTVVSLDAQLADILDRLDMPQTVDDQPAPDPAESDPLVMAAVGGDVPVMTLPYAHRLVAVEVLRRRGLSAPASAKVLRCGRKSVLVYRKAYREAREDAA